jgi:hypothetical protein
MAIQKLRGAQTVPVLPWLFVCAPNKAFAELVRLSRTSIADETREEHRRRVLGANDTTSRAAAVKKHRTLSTMIELVLERGVDKD